MNPLHRIFTHFTLTPSAVRRRLVFACFSLCLVWPAVRLAANTADFNGDLKADFLFQNMSTRICYVWMQNTTNFVGSTPIPITDSGGAPLVPDPGWKIVGTGYFRTSNTNQLGVVWQNQTNQLMAIWYLTSQTVFDTAEGLPTPGVGWKAQAVGDFDGDGKGHYDLAFQNENDGQKAVWLMNGTTFKSTGVIDTTSGGDWRITGTGDFGNAATPTSGAQDGKSDLVLTWYNPATDSLSITNACAIWFMNGLTIEAGFVLYDTIKNANAIVENSDWRALATGNFNPAADNKTDIAFRHATIGRQAAWFLSGYHLIGENWLKPEPDPALKLFSQDWLQSTWRNKSLFSSITANPSGSSVILNYRIRPYTNSMGTPQGVTIRRRPAGGSWANVATGVATDGQGAGGYTNSFSPSSGARYEYEVFREGNPESDSSLTNKQFFYPARVFTGISLTATNMENRGKVLVIVDSGVAANIISGLNTFTNDLIGDGWTVVLKTDAPRHDDGSTNCSSLLRTTVSADGLNRDNRVNLKNWIRTSHSDAKGIVLVGHVTFPLSGNGFNHSGHGDEAGAVAADIWYGDMGPDANWTEGVGTQQGVFFASPISPTIRTARTTESSTITLPPTH